MTSEKRLAWRHRSRVVGNNEPCSGENDTTEAIAGNVVADTLKGRGRNMRLQTGSGSKERDFRPGCDIHKPTQFRDLLLGAKGHLAGVLQGRQQRLKRDYASLKDDDSNMSTFPRTNGSQAFGFLFIDHFLLVAAIAFLASK